MATDDEGVVAVIGRSRLRVPYGELVTMAGRVLRLVPSLRHPRSWNGRASRSERGVRRVRQARAKPPFVFLHDRTLEALANRVPSSLAALAKVNGIGPAKLESYGDELLALIATARDGG